MAATMARPMPRLPPVTRHTLPSKSFILGPPNYSYRFFCRYLLKLSPPFVSLRPSPTLPCRPSPITDRPTEVASRTGRIPPHLEAPTPRPSSHVGRTHVRLRGNRQ